MKYALIKNIPLNQGLFTRTAKDQIDWNKYGLGLEGHRLMADANNKSCGQGWTAQQVKGEKRGEYVNIFPITDQDKFDAQLPALQAYCENTLNPNDSIERIDEIKSKASFTKIVKQKIS